MIDVPSDEMIVIVWSAVGWPVMVIVAVAAMGFPHVPADFCSKLTTAPLEVAIISPPRPAATAVTKF